MATIKNFTWDYLSDLVGDDFRAAIGRSRREINITVAADTTIPMGLLVFKAKDNDFDAPYAPVTDPTTQIVDTNLFGVVFGDGVMERLEFTSDESGTTKAQAFVGGEIVLQDRLILKVNGIERDSAEHKALAAILEQNQNIYLYKTLERVFP